MEGGGGVVNSFLTSIFNLFLRTKDKLCKNPGFRHIFDGGVIFVLAMRS